MGMSSSQARLLSLTSRMSDLEYSAQSIANSKLRLAADSDQVSRKYLAALDKKVLTVHNGDTNAYMDANAYNLTTYGAVSKTDRQRFLKSAAGEVLVSQKIKEAFENAKTTPVIDTKNGRTLPTAESLEGSVGLGRLLKGNLGYTDRASAEEAGIPYDAKQVTYYTNWFEGKEAFLQSMGYTSDNETPEDSSFKYDADAASYYSKLYDEMAENGSKVLADDKLKDSDWLYENLSNGTVFLAEYDDEKGKNGTGDVVEISWNSGDPTLAEGKCDETDLAKAEVEYERESKEIATKDKKFDMELKTIDTEHTAIQTEMDSVQKVMNKNIERTFKIFDA